MGTTRGTRAQRGLSLDTHAPTGPGGPERELHDGPADGILPMAPGELRRLGWLLAPIWHAGFAVLAVAGAVHATLGSPAPLIAPVLYASAGSVSAVIALVVVTLQLQTARGGAIPLAAVQAIYLASPLASAFLLSAAYVTRLSGGAFFGGFSAMVGLTFALVMLARRTSELRLGSAGPVSERRTPTSPVRVAVPAEVADPSAHAVGTTPRRD